MQSKPLPPGQTAASIAPEVRFRLLPGGRATLRLLPRADAAQDVWENEGGSVLVADTQARGWGKLVVRGRVGKTPS